MDGNPNCEHCGASVLAGASFCGACGARREVAAPQVAGSPLPPPVPFQSAPPATAVELVPPKRGRGPLTAIVAVVVVALLAIIGYTISQSGDSDKSSDDTGSGSTISDGSSSSDDYPGQVRSNYLNACEDAGSTKTFCTCSLEYIEARMSIDEFAAEEQKYASTGELNSVFTDAQAACL